MQFQVLLEQRKERNVKREQFGTSAILDPSERNLSWNLSSAWKPHCVTSRGLLGLCDLSFLLCCQIEMRAPTSRHTYENKMR